MAAAPEPSILDVLDQMGRLTRVEDRDSLGRGLLESIRRLVPFEQASLFDVAVRPQSSHLHLRSRVGQLQLLPLESIQPQARLRCLDLDAVDVAQAGRWSIGRWPLRTQFHEAMVLELATAAPVSDVERAWVEAIARVYLNLIHLLDQGERDTLTTLLNRKSFDDSFLRITRQVRQEGPVAEEPDVHGRHAPGDWTYWLAVMDIDHFKRVNDRFGHLIGDEVLLLMAQLMREAFRHGDRLYRFGGEEFVVLLACDAAQTPDAIFERWRERVAAHPFPQVGQITVSIGYTRIQSNDTPSTAFDRADQAVYLAKARGRNQVRCFEVDVAADRPTVAAHDGSVELF